MTKPYGYVRADGEGIFIYGEDKFQKIKDVVEFIPIYTEPPQRTWVGLTDEEMRACNFDENGMMDDREYAYRRIEAKLKQKNGYAEDKNT